MKKFENRRVLFKEILSEIYKFHLNYKEELNKLNINIKQIITQHSNKLQTGVAKRTLSKYSNEDPFSDKLISESVQQLLNYYLNKYSLISEEAEEIKNLISEEQNTNNNDTNSEHTKILKQEEQKINGNILNLNKAKNKYYTMMSKLEEHISKIEENKKKLLTKSINNNNIKTKKEEDKKDKKEKKEEKKIEEQKINTYMVEEVVRAKEAYMLALDTLNLTKREYLNYLNSFNDTIKEYDLNENDLLNQILQIFEKYHQISEKKIDEIKGIILENKNSEKENVIFIDKINKKYEFEEYIPQHNNIYNNEHFIVLSEMNKCTGFNIEESFSDPKIKKEIKFILVMEKILTNCASIKKIEIDSIKEFLKDKEYINKFLTRLNKARVEKELEKDKIVFEIIVELFNYILSNLVVDSKNNHDIIKNLLILTQSFYINDEQNNKKIFFSNKISTPKEFKTSEFWIEFIEKEIENNKENVEQKEEENKNKQNEVVMLFIGNITILNDYLSNQSKIKEVFAFFDKKYTFNEDNIRNVSDILGFNIK